MGRGLGWGACAWRSLRELWPQHPHLSTTLAALQGLSSQVFREASRRSHY